MEYRLTLLPLLICLSLPPTQANMLCSNAACNNKSFKRLWTQTSSLIIAFPPMQKSYSIRKISQRGRREEKFRSKWSVSSLFGISSRHHHNSRHAHGWHVSLVMRQENEKTYCTARHITLSESPFHRKEKPSYHPHQPSSKTAASRHRNPPRCYSRLLDGIALHSIGWWW